MIDILTIFNKKLFDIKRVHDSWKDDSNNYRIRGWAILARTNSYNSGNWQDVRRMQRGAEHVLIWAKTIQLERCRIAKRAPWRHIRFLAVVGRNKRAERRKVPLFGYHLTIQELVPYFFQKLHERFGKFVHDNHILLRRPYRIRSIHVNRLSEGQY